jgi:hypothetical protein
MDSESEGVAEASSARSCQTADRQAQKGLCPGFTLPRCEVTTQTDTGVKHHPKITENGYSERSNPSIALV